MIEPVSWQPGKEVINGMARRRSQKELKIDRATARDRLSDADLQTAVVTFPKKVRKVSLNITNQPCPR
jgi:hypothetical protein